MGLELKERCVVVESNGASLVSERLKGVPLAATWGDRVTWEAAESLNWGWFGGGLGGGGGWRISRVVLNFN